jgi:hypothetical protein
MARYTATLSAQNINVYMCDIIKPRSFDTFFANAMANGTFGGGTVSFNISFDNGTTLFPLTQDGVATAASLTAIGTVNIRCGWSGTLGNAKLYASIGTATSPSLTIIVMDNR